MSKGFNLRAVGRIAAIPLASAFAFGLTAGTAEAAGTTYVGGYLSDTAVIDGNGVTAGTIVFSLYLFPPGPTGGPGPVVECSPNTLVYQVEVPITGPGTYATSPTAYQALQTGTYQWVAAVYSGAATTLPALPTGFEYGGFCGDPSEQWIVTSSPELHTTPNGTNGTPAPPD